MRMLEIKRELIKHFGCPLCVSTGRKPDLNGKDLSPCADCLGSGFRGLDIDSLALFIERICQAVNSQ